MEFTLKDTLDMLTETRTERLQQIEALTNEMFETSQSNVNNNSDEIRMKQHKMYRSLLKEVVQDETKDYPIPRTLDLQVQVFKELEEQKRRSEDLHKSLKERLSSIREDISYLQNKKTGLENMRKAYLEHEELTANTAYTAEKVIARRMFKEVKADLDDVINVLYPDNQQIRDFLARLINASVKGGDDVYVDIVPGAMDFENLLIEADIVAYHRNDKKKMRLMDMI